MHKLAVNEAVEAAMLDQLALAATACAPFIIDAPRRLRAVTAIFPPTTRKRQADRAGRPAKKSADAPPTVVQSMLGENHPTFLTVEVFASSAHRNSVCPAGSGCFT